MKGRFLVAALIIFVVAQSCSHEDGARPEIKKKELIDLLVDIHLVDGYLAYNGTRIDRERDCIEGVYGYVLSKYNVTPKQFSNTMKYYSRHMADYEQIYNKVIEKLTLYETENLNAADTTPRRPEAIKKRLKSRPTR